MQWQKGSMGGVGSGGVLHGRRRSEAGFSVVESLVAAALLLIIAVGVLPLFTQSISSNFQGRQASNSVNEARSAVERLVQLDFNSEEWTIPAGSSELEAVAYWSDEEEIWVDEDDWDGSEPEIVTRTVTIRQFGIRAMDDGVLLESEALSGNAPPESVHIKEVTVVIDSTGMVGAPGKRMTLRTLRSA